MKRTILYQGIPGAFSHIAAAGYFGDNHSFTGLSTFFDIFNRIENNRADYGVIPVENSLAGSVLENYDLLFSHDVTVTGEYYQLVQHNVLVIKNKNRKSSIELKDLHTVYSHPKALEQCVKFFRNHPHIKPQAYNDTAEAAQFIGEEKRGDIAAIASKEAADLYGLDILARDIQDNPNNLTRFLIITSIHRGQDILEHDTVYKCSVMFTLPHKPGSLYSLIGIFANAHLNLSKIESRPIHGTTFEYVFSIDIEFHSHDYALVRELIQRCSEITREIKVLGYYRKAQIEK
jgi:prephenate dehydratase